MNSKIMNVLNESDIVGLLQSYQSGPKNKKQQTLLALWVTLAQTLRGYFKLARPLFKMVSISIQLEWKSLFEVWCANCKNNPKSHLVYINPEDTMNVRYYPQQDTHLQAISSSNFLMWIWVVISFHSSKKSFVNSEGKFSIVKFYDICC